MKKCILLTVIGLLSFVGEGFSQYKIDYGFSLGAANYLGEIGGKEQTRRDFIWDMKLKQTSFAVGGFFRYKFNPFVAGKASVTFGQIRGADSLSENRGRVGRNLSFRNNILEIAATADIYLWQLPDVGGRGRYRMDVWTYAFVGVAGYHHNPKALYNGSWTELRPLKTEGQVKEYGKWGISIPTGLGMFFTYKRQHRFGWDLGWRITFTDYLDDISTTYPDPSTLTSQEAVDLSNRRLELPNDGSVPIEEHYGAYTTAEGELVTNKRGDPTHNDTYFFTTLSYSYVVYSNNFYTQNYSWLSPRRGKYRKKRSKF